MFICSGMHHFLFAAYSAGKLSNLFGKIDFLFSSIRKNRCSLFRGGYTPYSIPQFSQAYMYLLPDDNVLYKLYSQYDLALPAHFASTHVE